MINNYKKTYKKRNNKKKTLKKKTQPKQNTPKKISKKLSYEDKFITDTRLNLDQMKYCSCVVNVRRTLKNNNRPYGICYSTLKKSYDKKNKLIDNKRRTLKKKKIRHKKFSDRINNVNCTMNYNYDNMNYDDLLLLVKERKITFDRTSSKNKNTSKKQLIRMLRTNYFDKTGKSKIKKN